MSPRRGTRLPWANSTRNRRSEWVGSVPVLFRETRRVPGPKALGSPSPGHRPGDGHGQNSKQSFGPTGQRFRREGVGPLALSTFAATRLSRRAANAMHGLQCQFPFPSHLLLSAWRIVQQRGFARGRVSPRRKSAFFRSQSLQQFPSLVDALHHALQLREFARLGHSFLAHVCGTTLLVVICQCGRMFFVVIRNTNRRATFSVRQG